MKITDNNETIINNDNVDHEINTLSYLLSNIIEKKMKIILPKLYFQ
jgi:hypothetical protein